MRGCSIGRDLLACATVGELTLFAGGSAPQANQSETAIVDIWDHSTDSWSTTRLSQPRKKPVAVVAGHKVLIAGGEIHKPPRGLGGYSAVVDIFDSKTRTWTQARLSMPRQYFGGASATADIALFAGGFGPGGLTSRLGVVDLYDAKADKWTLGRLSVNRSNLHAASIGGRYAAFGSGNIDDASKMAFDFYDGVTGKWAPSHGHHKDNPEVAGVRNVALFAGSDGVVDALAIDGDCSVLPAPHLY